MDGDILLEEAPAEIGHDRLGLPLGIGVARVDALLRLGQDFQRRGPRLVGGDAAVLAEGEPAQLAAHAGLEDVILPARFPDAEGEAGQLAVPIDGIGAVRLDGLDGAPGELGDAVWHGTEFLTSAGQSSNLANYWQTLWMVSQRRGGAARVRKKSEKPSKSAICQQSVVVSAFRTQFVVTLIT